MRIVAEAYELDVDLPREGETWLLVASGILYDVRERDASGAWRYAWPLGVPEGTHGEGRAIWDLAVRDGAWIRVMNCPARQTVG